MNCSIKDIRLAGPDGGALFAPDLAEGVAFGRENQVPRERLAALLSEAESADYNIASWPVHEANMKRLSAVLVGSGEGDTFYVSSAAGYEPAVSLFAAREGRSGLSLQFEEGEENEALRRFVIFLAEGGSYHAEELRCELPLADLEPENILAALRRAYRRAEARRYNTVRPRDITFWAGRSEVVLAWTTSCKSSYRLVFTSRGGGRIDFRPSADSQLFADRLRAFARG